MFPGDLLAKLTSEGLKLIAGRLASRSRDSQKLFAKDLFRFHEAVGDYKYHANELYKILTRPRVAEMRKNSMEFHNLLDSREPPLGEAYCKPRTDGGSS